MDNQAVPLLPIYQSDSSPSVVLPTVGHAQQNYLLKGLHGVANTEWAYRADLANYAEWCQQQGLTALPATAAMPRQYVSALAPHKEWATIARWPCASGGFRYKRAAPAQSAEEVPGSTR